MTQLPVVQPGQVFLAGAPIVFEKIGIVGLGLIGGSIALAARQLWPKALVIGVDNKDVLETAMRLHAIDVAADDLIVLAEADIVMLAAPVKTNIALLAELDANIRQPAVVTDTGSTKRDIAAAAASLPARFTFIGGHPLAGAAQGGLEHARPDLFNGRPWLLTPEIVTDGARAFQASEAVEKLTAFVTALGAVPRLIGAQAHDRLLAFLSHLPQLTAMISGFDAESVALFESYLDRRFPAWRQDAQGDAAGRQSRRICARICRRATRSRTSSPTPPAGAPRSRNSMGRTETAPAP